MENKETLEEFIKEVLQDEFFTNISEHKKAERLIEIGAKWMLEKLQDFDTWKEWKDMAYKEETIVTEYRDGNIKVETFKSE